MNKRKIQQCQGEKVHFTFKKDCNNCKDRYICYVTKVKPIGVKVINKFLIFAETREEAYDYASNGHGLLVRERQVGAVFPLEVRILEDGIYVDDNAGHVKRIWKFYVKNVGKKYAK
jgi:hypothetical protein